MFRPLAAYAGFSFVLLQVINIIFPALRLPGWTQTFVVILVLLGFPITIFFAWVYDITPSGIKKTSSTNQVGLKSKKILLPVTGFLTIVGGAFWIWYGLVGVTSATDIDFRAGIKKSIAILHFENLTGNKEGDYFCSALTEQIRGSLSKLGKLDIASRLISDKLKNKSENQTIYEDLDYYVEGTLSRALDNNNINISLINAQNHKVRWAQQYTFAENDIVQYKDTILNNIALNLNIDYEPMQLISQKKVYKNSDEFKLLGQGLFEFENNNFVAALSSFNSILSAHPNNIEALFHKANALVKLEKIEGAIKIYNNLISQTKHDHFGWKWSIKERDDVDNGLYAAFNDLSSGCFDASFGVYKQGGLIIVLLRGEEISRLIAYDTKKNVLAWEEIVPARFSNSSAPVIMNNMVYLTLNQGTRDLESTIFFSGSV